MTFNMDSDMCRLCGKNYISLMNVFDNNIESDVCHKIDLCFGVQIKEDDPITKKICKSCYFFTNSVYEYRLNCVQHDLKIRREYAESVKKLGINTRVPPITYPCTQISQDAFLNSLNLTNKNDSQTSEKPFCHHSVIKLKRKFPKVTIPVECNKLDLDPYVLIETTAKKSKPTNKRKVRTTTKFYHRKRKAHKKSILEQNSKEIENRSIDNQNNLCPIESSSISSNITNNIDIPKQHISTKKDMEKENDRNTVKNLIQSDVNLTKSLFKLSTNSNNNDFNEESNSSVVNLPDNNDSSVNTKVNASTKIAEDNNLLMMVGQEIQTFICQTCNKIFDTKTLLNNHKKYNHKSSLRCSKCSKRFSVVEALVKHSLQYHSEASEPSKENEDSNSKTNDSQNTIVTENNTIINKSTFASTSQARKRTHGILNNSSNVAFTQSDQQEHYDISSDDDMEITDITNQDTEKAASQLKALLMEGKSEQPILQNILSKKNQLESDKPNEDQNIDLTGDEDVFLIDDSDNETAAESELNKKATDETNEFTLASASILIDDNSNSNCADTNDNTTDNQDKNSAEDTSSLTDDSSIKQKMVVVLTDGDGKNSKASTSNAEKLTYELNYINYILNKHNFGNKLKSKCENTWLLKGIQALPSNVYLPIELTKSNEDIVSVFFGPCSTDPQTNKSPVWNLKNVIDMPKTGTSNQEKESSKNSLNNEQSTSEKVTQSVNPPEKTVNLVQNAETITAPEKINVSSGAQSERPMSGIMSNNVPVVSTPRTTNVVLPTVSVSPLLLSNVKCTQKLLNFALNNAASKYAAQRNQIRQYSGPAVKGKPTEQPPSEVVNQIPFQPVSSAPSFILMGVSPSQTSHNTTNFSQNLGLQPAVLNVPSLPPVSSLQQLGQTNVNIQNCVNINQQQFRTSVNNLVGPYTMPIVFQDQLGVVSTSATLQPVCATSENSSNVVNTPKPAIRIKNLSELRDSSFNAGQTNQLHSLYSEKLISLAAKRTSVITEHATADEYIQI